MISRMINEKFNKPYNPQETEGDIYKKWERSGFFNPDNLPSVHKEPFSIALPPPNVTGTLHMGSALMLAIQDIIIRFERMRGKKTLWLPGTDHAAIATQSKVEKELSKQNINKKDLGRDEFLKRVGLFARESHDTIVDQIKKMGSSVDWSREAFTLDEKRSFAVKTAFVKMYEDGLIYRGDRIVNWDPKGQTVISDDEIVYKEEKTKFYYLKYGPFTIGTARPETKFGDKYVVMHPEDPRYKDYKHGQKIELEWINGPITATVIKDGSVDMEFGTGVMTITPWHSAADFEIAQRHNLDKEQIIDKYGKLLPLAEEFAEIKIAEARLKIVEKLRLKDLLVKEEEYTHNVATAERSEGVVEPQIMRQWFIAVDKIFERDNSSTTLKKIMHEVVEKGKIKILPERFEKIYYHWIDNLHDWCISRQLWYGHRIPAWYKDEQIYVGLEAPGEKGWVQDEDTLDTWFSSGLWTFSTLGWPEQTSDLKTYHPTSVLETGYDILFFWIARMILMSGYLLKEIPFKTVYLHGLVRDEKGRKLSKSLGNNIDPVEMIERYGADAVRMAMIIGTSPGSDSKVSLDKIKAYKHFANKIWNATRFTLEHTSPKTEVQLRAEELSDDDQKILREFESVAKDITEDMENYRFYLAAEKIYHYFWHIFADVILEKKKKMENKQILRHLLIEQLKLLHPFMPFITEEIWSHLPESKNLLLVEPWPKY